MPIPLSLLGALALGSSDAQAALQDPALINLPVAPEAIYVVRGGAQPGMSVIDLNGFGQGTGNPIFDPVFSSASEGTSMFPYNPNVMLQGGFMNPPLSPGTSTLDGGSAGIFTLSKDSLLSDLLTPAQGVGRLGDMMLGQPLDLVYNNGPAPFGCQVGGGSVCSISGLKLIGTTSGVAVGGVGPVPQQLGNPAGLGLVGGGNPISWAPHPNPPPLMTVPLCEDPGIRGQEPTSVSTLMPGLTDLLVPGDAFGDPGLGIAPSGSLGSAKSSYFVGPSQSAASIGNCETYQLRQQVGHFLYAIDEDADELVVLNSNRMTVLARIALADPTELAMDPNLNFIAVTNRATDTVSVIDINPSSATFHQIVKTIPVGDEPTGIAWQPDDEDLLVCNAGDSSLSIISTFTFNVRKTVQVGSANGFALAVTPRLTSFGAKSDVYYAWILDEDGRVWLFESGPAGIGGWGYDDVVLQSSFKLPGARTLQLDPLEPSDKVWVVHDQRVTGSPVAGGAVTQLQLRHRFTGPMMLVPGSSAHPRGKRITVARTIGADVLTGRPMDLAFDNLLNQGVFPTFGSMFSSGASAATNSKHPLRLGIPITTFGGRVATNQAEFMFLPVHDAVAGTERIDVIDLATGQRVDTNAYQPGVQSIPAAGAQLVMDYFRQ